MEDVKCQNRNIEVKVYDVERVGNKESCSGKKERKPAEISEN